MVFVDNWTIFALLLLTLLPIFLVTYGIYHAIHYQKTYILKMIFVLLILMFFSMYYIYCRYIDQQKIAHYCINEQCISIVYFYKSLSINAPMYAKIYEGKILFRFQTEMKNYAELLMEDDILIHKKTLENKFIIYGSLPVMHGNVDTIEIKEVTGYIDQGDHDYIVSEDLKFKYLY